MKSGENIHVSLRFRPLNQRELEERDPVIWNSVENSVALKPEYTDKLWDEKRGNVSNKVYTYNKIYGVRSTNEELYQTSVREMVLASLEGYNGTVFAYG